MTAPEQPHNERGMDCWCKPVVEHLCDNCYARQGVRDECWKCGGAGWVSCDRGDACNDHHVVLHRYHKGTPGACYFLEDA